MSPSNHEEKPVENHAGPAERTRPADVLIETHHRVTVAGQDISYRATAGTLVLREEAEQDGASEGEKAKATLFFVAYTRDNAADPAERPITFSFNGGPGSSSVWLHLGLLGPRRVAHHDVDSGARPPYRLEDNPLSLLDQTDLVFIDPVSTGYSRAVVGEKPGQFHDFKKDIESVGDFIRLYTSRYRRWASPKFLIGESYGTTRAGGLSGYLQQRHGMYLNGIMLVSSILDFMTAQFVPGNDLPYLLFLPTYTAIAWYHGRLPADLQSDLNQAVQAAESFALGTYALALLQGDALEPDERTRLAAQLARLTGLSPAFIERAGLRIEIHRFCKELLRDSGRTVGRLDGRYLGIDRDAAGEKPEFDPSLAAITGPYTATFNDYARRELGVEFDLPYEVLTGRVQPWRFGEHENQFVNVAETLRQAMCMNPSLKVHVASGYYDLATPYLATVYTFNHLQLDAALRDNISMSIYEAGHMMYVHLPSLALLRQNLSAFISGAVA